MSCMKSIKKFQHTVYICAFIYLVLCPAVHQLVDAVNHDIVIISEARLQHREYHKNPDSNLTKIFSYFQPEPLNHTIPITSRSITPSPLTSFNLSALSTVRLNL